ncbi:hypothetical protein BKA61DRAFT_481787, partial [Leptodontidium sp. MPI-SDFR-AT-0119]
LIISVTVAGIETKALVDSGAIRRFINPSFIKNYDIPTLRYHRPYRLNLLDGKKAGQDD